jgi:hypothetical protein
MSEIGKFVEERLFRLNKRPITAATEAGWNDPTYAT